MPSNRCATCESYIHFVPGVGWVTSDQQKCKPNQHVTAPHIPIRKF